MTNQQHPITPPPELVTSLRNLAPHGIGDTGLTRELWLINHAYAAGADQELEACCEWFEDRGPHPSMAADVRSARRPKPPSLKEQALQHVGLIQDNWARLGDGLESSPSLTGQITLKQLEDIRRALEALPE